MMKRTFLIIMIMLSSVMGGFWTVPDETAAQSAKATLRLHTVVGVHTRMNVDFQAEWLFVTSEDIRNGYIEVADGTVYSVKTNSRDGYVISYTASDNFFKNIMIIDGIRNIELAGGSGFVHMPYKGTIYTGETKHLSYRFYLSPDARPGKYRWPLLMSLNTSF